MQAQVMVSLSSCFFEPGNLILGVYICQEEVVTM